MTMPEPLKRLRLSSERVRPLIWIFPIACAVAGGFSVVQQYQREFALRAELDSTMKKMRAFTGEATTESSHEH